jgi:hypothetical protein
MLSRLILSALFVLSSHALWARELVIVSDLDETLRMANIEHYVKAGLKLLPGVRRYEGLTAIFQEIQAKNPEAKFYYLSNSYPFLYNGKNWLKKNDLPEGVVIQRALDDKTEEFKPSKLADIYAAHPEAEFLLFGDNVENDPRFYQKFVEDHKLECARIFIRDALFTFPSDQQTIYFQAETQITDDLEISPETTKSISGLPVADFFPRFLLANYKRRLIQGCKGSGLNCRDKARSKVKEILELVSPEHAEEELHELESSDDQN